MTAGPIRRGVEDDAVEEVGATEQGVGGMEGAEARPGGGDADLRAELGTMFATDSARSTAAMAEAIIAGDAVALDRAAHSLKGASASVGAPFM